MVDEEEIGGILNDRQEQFCREYIIDFNGARACRVAGYSEKAAKEIASRLLTNANIQNRINTLKENIFEAVGITQYQVYRELKRIALFDIKKIYNKGNVLMDIADIDPDTAAAITGVECVELGPAGTVQKVKIASKQAALDRIISIAGWNAPVKSELEVKEVFRLGDKEFEL